jgi:hypothetical protein
VFKDGIHIQQLYILSKTLARRFYPLHIDFSSELIRVCTYSAKTNRIRCLHISREETLYSLLLIAIVNDLSETAITFIHRGVKCVDVSADRGHGVRGKWKYSSVILLRPLMLMRAGSLVISAIKGLFPEGVHVTLLISVYDRARTWRIPFFRKTLPIIATCLNSVIVPRFWKFFRKGLTLFMPYSVTTQWSTMT